MSDPVSCKRQDDSRREGLTLLSKNYGDGNFGLRVAINGRKRCFWFSRLVVGDALEAYMEKKTKLLLVVDNVVRLFKVFLRWLLSVIMNNERRGLYSLSENGNPVMQPVEDRINERRGLYSLSENGNPVMQPVEDRINVHFESIVDDVLLVVVPEEL